MKNQGLRIAFAILSVYILVACQQNRAERHGDPTVTSAPETGPIRFGGTSDQAGGGNLIEGKPIEFYKTDVTDATLWPEYENYIEPIDQSITKALGTGSEILKTAARWKTWYRLPIEFDELPKEMIGVNFRSSQGAYQTNKEVFLSDPPKKESDTIATKKGLSESSEERAKLFLHELVMTWYLIKYEDLSFYCAAYGEEDVNRECQTSLTMNSLNKSLAPAAREEFLSNDDYESIRHVTEWLWTNHKGLTRRKLYEKLIEKNFDPRVYNMTAIDYSDLPLKTISKQTLIDSLLAQQNANQLPRFCGFDSETQVTSKAECEIKFTKLSETRLRLVVNSTAPNGEKNSQQIDLALPKYTYDRPVQENSYLLEKQVFRKGMIFHSLTLPEAEEEEMTPSKIDRITRLLLSEAGPSRFRLEGIMLQKWSWSLQKEEDAANDPNQKKSWMGEAVRLTGFDETIRFIFNVKNPPIYPEELN